MVEKSRFVEKVEFEPMEWNSECVMEGESGEVTGNVMNVPF